MSFDHSLAVAIILQQQRYIAALGFTPLVHFELEGCCQFPSNRPDAKINIDVINRKLKHRRIEGHLVEEYWLHQWEYVSDFSGQTPLKEARNLAFVIEHLPQWFSEQGATNTLIKPVVWSGDSGKLAHGSKNIFTSEARAVHIPNAIQVNVSALNCKGENIICDAFFGEYLQQCFLETSLACCLLYMPEPDAFERFALKSKYGLADELCSPTDISGGHQGSIALYKEVGKHNQPMGVEPVLLDQFQQALVVKQNWQKTARVEHRLGASSSLYNPYFNVIFALANLIDALEVYNEGQCQQQLNADPIVKDLPLSLAGDDIGFDALSLFKKSNWLANSVNHTIEALQEMALNEGEGRACYQQLNDTPAVPNDAGKQLKQQIIESVSFINY